MPSSSFRRVVTAIEVVALVAAVVFVVMLFANGSGGGGGGGGGGAGGGSPGARLFADNCATCHGADGQGAVGPQLAGRMTQRFPDVEDQIRFVSQGSGGMPSFAGRLSPQQIRQVVEYTRTGLTG
ncbi:MAG TPA: cytochrome c [Acidimicrobiia bacterium]|nr:cytochrome c [Acidimicrobiia bacterium]